MISHKREARTYFSLIILAFGTFVAQTTEYLPIGLLPQIGAAFTVSDSYVGALVTGYAWIAALTAIPFTLATLNVNRRTLFLCLIGIITVANAAAALSSNYWFLAFFRIVAALTHGVFWSTIATFAIRVAPSIPAGRATSIVFVGISLSIVGGVPLAAVVSQWVDWRVAFGIFAVLGLVSGVSGYFLLPSISVDKSQRFRRTEKINRSLYRVAIITALSLTAHFASYTYVVPLLKSVGHVGDSKIPLLLFAFGVAGLLGNLISGWLSAKVERLVILAVAGIVCVQVIMLAGAPLLSSAWPEMIIWGASISMLIVGLQTWTLKLAPDNADMASALLVTTFNLGIGCGAFLGGATLEVGGPRIVLVSAVVCGSIALCSMLARGRRGGTDQTKAT